MAGKITEMAALTDPASADLIEVVDVSDLSMATTGTNKTVRVGTLSTLNLSHVYVVPPNTVGFQLFFGATGVSIVNSAANLSATIQPASDCRMTSFGVWASTAVTSATFAAALFNIDVRGYPTTKVADIVTALDCSTTGAKTVTGLSIPVTAGTMYGIVTLGGAVAPTLFGLSGGTSGASPASSRGAGALKSGPSDNLARFETHRFVPTTPGVIDANPTAWALGTGQTLTNVWFKLESP